MAKAREPLLETDMGLWTTESPFEGKLLACYQTLIEITSMTEGHKIILKLEIHIMCWIMLEKYANGEGSARKSSLIKQKWFIQEHATGRMQGEDTHEQGASFPLGLASELQEKLPNPLITWTAPYKEPLNVWTAVPR